MDFESKNVTNWVIFIFVTLSTFGVVYQAIASTNKEIEKISSDIIAMNQVANTNLAMFSKNNNTVVTNNVTSNHKSNI